MGTATRTKGTAIIIAMWCGALVVQCGGTSAPSSADVVRSAQAADAGSVPGAVEGAVSPPDKPDELEVDKFKIAHAGFKTVEADPEQPKPPYLVPYEPVDIISEFHDRRGRRGIHGGIDFAGVGRNCGLGTPIYSIGRARIELIGRPEDDPLQFGRPVTRGGSVRRGSRRLPATAEIDGYGQVHFFTRNRGSWRAGGTVVTVLLDGPLAGCTVRYMHLGAIHPELHVGDILDAGEEFALLGGTAIQESIPHVHLDGRTPDGRLIDLAPYLDFDSAATEVEAPPDDEIPGCKGYRPSRL